MINKFFMNAGAALFIVGIGGMAGACEGQGSFLVSAIVFSVGFGLAWANFKKGTECDR